MSDPFNQKTPTANEPARKRVPYSFAQEHGVMLLKLEKGVSCIGYRPTATPTALQEVSRIADRPAQFTALTDKEFDETLGHTYQTDATVASDAIEDTLDLDALMENVPVSEDLLAQEDDAPVIRLINALLSDAVDRLASDIHIETFELRVVVRFRIDGVLREVIQPKRALAQILVSRIKIMAQLDIAEKRVPQDGRISVKLGHHEVDVRVSTIPTRHGERVVLRLLDRSATQLSLPALGMGDSIQQQFAECLALPHGIILVTGPTGSGKTTSLYAGLSHLNDGLRNIMTVEDPIEYGLEGIGQTQVNPKADMTFARGLRAILRQDPDVVMVGEVRDKETADMAIQASLTGHLVLSTLHTNTAVGAIARLIDMGIEPYLLASSLSAVMAQRLVRTLCEDCKTPITASPAMLREFADAEPNEDTLIYQAVGCPRCHGSGYRGRTGVYEMITLDEPLRHAVHERESDAVLTSLARKRSPSLRADGWRRIQAGITSVDEVLRVSTLQGSASLVD